MMNFANLLTAKKIREWWRGFVMVIILFAAIATPTGDPLNLMLVAVPILLLVVVAWAIAAANDWRRRRKGIDQVDISDDEASDISSDW
jgi:sec-independent protein translocase protein TatC